MISNNNNQVVQSKQQSKRAYNPHPTKADVYFQFILWFAMPTMERVSLGVDNQRKFADFYKVDEMTLSRWKSRPDFDVRVNDLRMKWGKEKTSDVVMGIYRAAVKGNPMSQLLWLQYFEKFTPKTQVEHTAKVEIGVNDIRFLIEGLPTQELRDKHYGNLRELLEAAQQARVDGLLESGDRSIGSEEDVQGEADINAQGISRTDANDISKGYPASVRAGVVWQVLSYHYQGTARRGEE